MRHLPLLLLALTVIGGASAEEPAQPGVPPGTKSEHQTMEGKVERVFEHFDGEYHYLAYQVTYQGSPIVVPVMFPKKTLKVGDALKYLAMKVEIPQEGKPAVRQITFMFLDAMNDWPAKEAENPPATTKAPVAPKGPATEKAP